MLLRLIPWVFLLKWIIMFATIIIHSTALYFALFPISDPVTPTVTRKFRLHPCLEICYNMMIQLTDVYFCLFLVCISDPTAYTATIVVCRLGHRDLRPKLCWSAYMWWICEILGTPLSYCNALLPDQIVLQASWILCGDFGSQTLWRIFKMVHWLRWK